MGSSTLGMAPLGHCGANSPSWHKALVTGAAAPQQRRCQLGAIMGPHGPKLAPPVPTTPIPGAISAQSQRVDSFLSSAVRW